MLLAQIIPGTLQARRATPAIYVFYSDDAKPVLSREIVADMEKPEGNVRGATKREVAVMPNFRFWDRGSLAIFFVVPMFNSPQSLSPGYVREVMERRTPALPRWFVEGMSELYGTTVLRTKQVTAGVFNAINGGGKNETDEVAIDPFVWISKKETASVKDQPTGKQRLLSMKAIFNGRPPRLNTDVQSMVRVNQSSVENPGGQYARTLSDGMVQLTPFAVTETAGPSYAQTWKAQSALFIRWSLEDQYPSRRVALWKFVERASQESVSETMLKEYFGLDYEQIEAELLAYLPQAVRRTLTLPLPYSADEPIEIRSPTATEISRIKGKLDRLEIGYIKARYPQLTERYLAQARKTLRRAYDQNSRDPRLLAELGLCECEAADDAAAEPFLRAAAAAHAVEPRVYFELARIIYNQARAQQPEAKFTEAQVTELLSLLSTARQQAPALPDVYLLIARVCAYSTQPPNRQQLAMLDEGIRHFPGQMELLYRTAKLQTEHGSTREASMLIELGLELANELDKVYFQELKTSLEARQTK